MARRVISDEERQFFLDNGYLTLREAVEGEELRRLRAAMDDVVAYGSTQVRDDPDYMYGAGHRSGAQVLRRVEYVIDKRDECKVLLGNPFILRSVEKLMGPDLIPTWDSMVLKMPGEGIVVPWHRDAGTGAVGDKPIFNVDFYLDEADEETCVWVIPGSHLWDAQQVSDWLAARPKEVVTRAEFVPEGAVPALMKPGDALFHNILVLHGSPANEGGKLRRVLYYEFRTAHVEAEQGPHVPAYIPLKQKEMLACIEKRKQTDYIPKEEEPFRYDPPAPFDTVPLNPDEVLSTYRYAHGDYWRPTTWTPDLSMQVRFVGQVRPSPDGSRVAYVVTESVMEDEKSEQVAQIHLANADGSDSHPLTYGEKSSRDPQWSPDGKELAFLSNRKEKTQLYRLRAAGGEAEPLTDVKADIAGFLWSPDGAQIVFLMPDPLSEDEENRNKGKADARWVDEEHKFNRLYLLHLQRDPAGKREPRKLTTENYHVTGFDWSPDGRQIVFAHQPTPLADDWLRSQVCVLDVKTGDVKPLVQTEAAVMQPYYSPDGRWIALTISDVPVEWAFSSTIHVVAAEGGTPRALPATFDSSPGLVGWSADSKSIYFAEARGTTTRLSAIDVESGKIEDLNAAGGMAFEFRLNQARTHVGFVHSTSERAPEAQVAALDDFSPRAVSRVNADLPALPLGKTETIRWRSRDGREIEGLLTYPVDYKAGTRVPLLLVIHGGPTGVFMESFIGMPSIYPLAAFAARGYAVLRCNPRGSSGYGKEFRFANKNDWGGGDYEDLMTGVDRVIEMGVADADRLGVMGWSYGGFMTSWVITQTQRFKAASVGAAVTNLVSFTGTSDIPGFLPSYFGGQFWENPNNYLRHSPMFHVKGVTTPTLIQHGESDIRVPIGQGYELYNALKAQGTPVRMLVLPRQPHGPNEPKMTLKTLQTNLEWFDKHLKDRG